MEKMSKKLLVDNLLVPQAEEHHLRCANDVSLGNILDICKH